MVHARDPGLNTTSFCLPRADPGSILQTWASVWDLSVPGTLPSKACDRACHSAQSTIVQAPFLASHENDFDPVFSFAIFTGRLPECADASFSLPESAP